ncbi:hypothetical protein CTheo_7377 [Ceratobasidium theobromae]|uniref:BTB domain-containing protein n=1 Tax=Ceratobasidium theobromae TaxID=1582974 RepID=A0A5N5QC15_9AGAM|nr:hypothetical protein CTheo_7377 [Ceratobasidium theobromae]
MYREPTYTLIFQDSRYTLTKSQIEFDSPNLFTTCFLGEYEEAQTRCLSLYRDPELFGIVVDYLCGYTVFRWDENTLPKRMTIPNALKNLRADAKFYGLKGLVKACDEFEAPASYRREDLSLSPIEEEGYQISATPTRH